LRVTDKGVDCTVWPKYKRAVSPDRRPAERGHEFPSFIGPGDTLIVSPKLRRSGLCGPGPVEANRVA
jgi:hypothetical protein